MLHVRGRLPISGFLQAWHVVWYGMPCLVSTPDLQDSVAKENRQEEVMVFSCSISPCQTRGLISFNVASLSAEDRKLCPMVSWRVEPSLSSLTLDK